MFGLIKTNSGAVVLLVQNNQCERCHPNLGAHQARELRLEKFGLCPHADELWRSLIVMWTEHGPKICSFTDLWSVTCSLQNHVNIFQAVLVHLLRVRFGWQCPHCGPVLSFLPGRPRRGGCLTNFTTRVQQPRVMLMYPPTSILI